jgi:hypothetical protein
MERHHLHNRRAPVRFLSHLPQQGRIHGDCCPVVPAHRVCVDPCLTPMSYHQEHHRRSLSVALLVMNFLKEISKPSPEQRAIARGSIQRDGIQREEAERRRAAAIPAAG